MIEVDKSTGEDADSVIAEVQPVMSLNEGNTPSDNLASATNFLTLDKATDAIDEVTTQAHHAHEEEAPEPMQSPDGFTDQPAKERLDSDSLQDANASATASIAEAISETKRFVPIDEPEVTLNISGGRVSEIDQGVSSFAQAFATPEVGADADGIDEDIDNIADEWPAPAISATLKRLRQARGLLSTDLSYDAGWAINFEAGRWHTYQTDRRRYIRGIRIYLQALGVTPAELQACLLQHTGQV